MKTKMIFFLCLLFGLVVTRLSAETVKRVIIITYSEGLIISKSIGFISESNLKSILEQGTIYVYPMQLDFGDVPVGEEKMMSFTVRNIGDDTMTLSIIALAVGLDWEIVTSVYPPYYLEPFDFFPDASDVIFVVSFSPTAEGYFTSEIILGSNDPVNPVMEVALVGRGVNISIDVEQIQLELESSVAVGSIEGINDEANFNSNLADKNLDHFREILQEACSLYNIGILDEACETLKNADRRSDGLDNPPDFITGENVWLINEMINELLSLWGCWE